MNDRIMMYDGAKSVNLKDLPEEAWTYLTGGEANQLQDRAVKEVPWLRRSIQIRKWAVGSMPFIITIKGETDPIDSSERYQNKVGFMANPRRMLRLLEESLMRHGKAYLYKDTNRLNDVLLRYYDPRTVKPVLSAIGIKEWERRKGKSSQNVVRLPKDEVIYIWPEDANVELGPPRSNDVMAALKAAKVLMSVDEFADKYFERGAIKPTILKIAGNVSRDERTRVKNWWQRTFTGKGNAWQTDVVNGDKVEAVVIGEGIAGLQDNALTQEKREDIATALGIPMTLVFSQAANRATATQDYKQLYQLTIVPECQLIEEALNEQLLHPVGYHLKFNPESLDVYQEDEERRAVSLQQMVSTGVPVDLGMDILGYDLTESQWQQLRDAMAEKKERSEAMTDRLVEEPEDANGMGASGRGVYSGDDEEDKALVDLEKWQRKALKALARGKSASCKFESEFIGTLAVAGIAGALESAESAEDVKAIFSDPWIGYP